MKVQVGICDDNIKDIDWMECEIHAAFDDVQVDYELTKYEGGNMLMHAFDSVIDYDILLLDIDMPGVDGMSIAEHIMQIPHRVNIIFVTNRDDMVFEAIHYSPFRFIRKEKLHDELPEAIVSAIDKIYKETLIYNFGTGAEVIKISICDILYLESQKHYICVHTKQGDVKTFRGKISDYTEELADVGFVRVHMGYLVNIRYIYSITSQKIVLDNEEELPISRAKVDDIKQRHASYMRRFVRGIN